MEKEQKHGKRLVLRNRTFCRRFGKVVLKRTGGGIIWEKKGQRKRITRAEDNRPSN